MNSVFRKINLSPLIAVLFLTACGEEDMINTKVEQAKILQQHSSEFAAACIGKLSMSTELTGDLQKPAITKLSCDDMDKESEFFKPFTDEELRALTEQIKRISNVD